MNATERKRYRILERRRANDARMLAAVQAFAVLVGHASNCARGCLVTGRQVFASAYCPEGFDLAADYARRAPYCCAAADPLGRMIRNRTWA